MNQEHGQGQEGETVGVRRSEGQQNVRPYTDGGASLSGVSAGIGSQSFTVDRKNSAAGAGNINPFGGVIDQLIDDAKKQVVKSSECITWYQAEVKEYQEKLNNLMKLKELQEQQWQEMQQQQMLMQQKQSQESSNQNGGESLAE